MADETSVPGGKPTELSDEQAEQAVGGSTSSFLKIDGVNGESTDAQHKDWVETSSPPPPPKK